MIRKRKKEKKGNADGSVSTFLGPDVTVKGTIEFKNAIRLDGKVDGKIVSSEGAVIVGEKAVIKAEIDVDIAIVMGEVNGAIQASKRIEIHPPGRVIGDIKASIISIEAGGVLNGNCSMRPRSIPARTGGGALKIKAAEKK